jgi:hypothetical protein
MDLSPAARLTSRASSTVSIRNADRRRQRPQRHAKVSDTFYGSDTSSVFVHAGGVPEISLGLGLKGHTPGQPTKSNRSPKGRQSGVGEWRATSRAHEGHTDWSVSRPNVTAAFVQHAPNSLASPQTGCPRFSMAGDIGDLGAGVVIGRAGLFSRGGASAKMAGRIRIRSGRGAFWPRAVCHSSV